MNEWSEDMIATCPNGHSYLKELGECPCGAKDESVIKITPDEIKGKTSQPSTKIIWKEHIFDSKIEYQRYLFLAEKEDTGEISDFRIHPKYPLIPRVKQLSNPIRPKDKVQRAISYTGDFEYVYQGILVIEDVKATYGNSKTNRAKNRVGKPIISESAKIRHKLLQWKYPDCVFKIIKDTNLTKWFD